MYLILELKYIELNRQFDSYLQESIQRIQQCSKDAKAGSLLTLGTGDTGQLGLGEDITERTKPSVVTGVSGKIIAVAAGGMHTICLTMDGVVWSFGCNDEGALGRNIEDDDEGNTGKCFASREGSRGDASRTSEWGGADIIIVF